MKLHIIACIYDIQPSFLMLKLNTYLRGYEFDVIIVNNNPHSQHIHDSSGRVHNLCGSNKYYEFSAYQEGIEYLYDKTDYINENVLILNDTLFTKHNPKAILSGILKYFQTVERLKIPAIAGRYDSYNNICYRNPWSGMSGYISSFCMLANSSALNLIRGSVLVISDIFPAGRDITKSDNWDSTVDGTFREFIISHLIDAQTPTSWYQSKSNLNNTDRLRIKGICVYLEHYISGKIGASDGVLISIFPTWKQKLNHVYTEQTAKVIRKIKKLLGI
ncbi:sugar polymerase [Hafnia paralvei]|uniref:Uncharacterized protein n=1 Tax=Hafnia alvei TaxID=569 RepID=A0A172WZS5_HAFAL|nr:sugar polymerase [Hafnia paralvei]ANF29868.1 hypothetical protein [Hafnia alvei]TBM12053.1 sugar polymerase [Hafnia paralvei]